MPVDERPGSQIPTEGRSVDVADDVPGRVMEALVHPAIRSVRLVGSRAEGRARNAVRLRLPPRNE
jgi:hypothetical protein